MTIQQQLESGLSHHRAGRVAEAERIYRRVLAQHPQYPDALHLLGVLAAQTGQLEPGVELIRRAVQLQPSFAEAHNSLGNALTGIGQLDEAIASYQEAIRLKPDYADAHCNLGSAFKSTGRLDEAVTSYRQAIRLKPDYAEAHSNLVFSLNYLPDIDAEAIFAEHQAWADRHARPLAAEIITHSNDRSPEKRLRIGYVSADFRRHSVSYFLTALLEHHNRRNLEIFCYSGVGRPDDMTERMKHSGDIWRNIVSLSDEEAAKLIRSDGIDILVDLSGHTARHRLCVFARKPAPIQVTYLGYANTTGLKAIDYRLTDALADPPGMTDQFNVEKLWRLPACAWCYQPVESPDIQPRGDGPITFGCFNAFAKINQKMLTIWAELLRRTPGSRLLLKTAGAAEASSRQRLTDQFAGRGIPGDRIEVLGRIPDPRQHLQLYTRVDVALDTYPYHGTTTTCEALWMGVPVVSLAGRMHVSRVGVSLLTHAGLPELIAKTPEEYLSIASELAANRARRDAMRAGMRSKLIASLLMDGQRFAAELEAAYRQMWRIWCERI
jgi:predicted O-linked N-acetylglucosamine transferase (SPINDLY family)